jgi:putative transposase
MTFVPRYNFSTGTKVTLHGQEMAIRERNSVGYEVANIETGEIGTIEFSQFVENLKSPGMQIERSAMLSTGACELRLGGMRTAEQLSKPQQEIGGFNHAVCHGALVLKDKLRNEQSNPDLQLTEKILNQKENREFISQVAGVFLGKKVSGSSTRGGPNNELILYKGRTILKYLKVYQNVPPEDDVIAALATLDHLKGNRIQRVSYRLKELMTEAWEEIGFDLKATSVSNVYNHFCMLVREENMVRKRNGLRLHITPSQKTLAAHRDFLLNPTEYLVATKGERYGRNKRGRGSSDCRALIPGELVEIDECRLSLITSAKACGYWEKLSSEDQKTLEKMDGENRSRLTLLVMIDVATRMPLAWVLSENPGTEATMQLFRMATRDKTKEKIKYGALGDPVPAIGLWSVRSDNGTGLRNSTAIGRVIGVGGSFTAVRTYASADKPYVERFFGTTESTLIKLIHGYTGRKANELPGYDAKANGVLNLDELYGIITRFFIDEYPSMRHMGVGMGGRRPAEVLKELNQTRGLTSPLDDDVRRIHLGWKREVTPNDEGVRVFSGLWYSSPAFQKAIDDRSVGKISVFVDPDNVNEATAVIPGDPENYRLQLQVTAFADMTIPEVLELTEAFRYEEPEVTEIHEDRLASTRRERSDLLKQIGVERNLPRSYSTVEECIAKARSVFGGARIVRSSGEMRTVPPGEINSRVDGPGLVSIGGDTPATCCHTPEPVDVSRKSEAVLSDEGGAQGRTDPSESDQGSKSKTIQSNQQPLGRPTKKGIFK